MSTFSGYIPEIPYISVDRFTEENKNARMFFLSHCHTDHMRGLNEADLRNMLFANLNVSLYASPISVRILKNKYCDLAMQLKELPMGIPKTVQLPTEFGEAEQYLNITTIGAGHCPGSVMFLFETNDKNFLYTGDYRINTADLHKYKAFHDSTGNVKKIDVMYLDTTFCNSTYEHFSSRIESTSEICRLVDEWTSVSDKHIIDLSMGAFYGSEYLFLEVFKRTNKRIHVLHEVYNLYKYMPDIAKIITTNPKKAKVHTRQGYTNSCCTITSNATYFVRSIRPTAMVWDYYKPQEAVVREEVDSSYRVCYSSHASLSEIREFVRYLKPLHIEPCVVPDDLEDKQKLFAVLAEMMSEYNSREEVVLNTEEEQFPLENVLKGDRIKAVGQKRKLNLLSSPPRNYTRKRFTSESNSS